MFAALWGYRGFIFESIRREFQSQYTNAMLGAVWTIVRPLSMIVVYTVIFSQIMKAKLPGVDSEFAYSIYLCAGILTWGLFSETVSRLQNVFLEQANLLKKINFPRLSLPVIVVVNALVNFSIIFALFTLFLAFSGYFPGVVFVALIPVLAIQTLFSLGLGVTLGVLNVFFRDVGQFFTVVLQFWFWLTPVVYPASILPQKMQTVLQYNPMTILITSYQQILVNGVWPNWHTLWPVALVAVLLCAWGLKLFREHAGEMVDEL
ncbi:MAG: ABC transporter permease [Burkholderiaceae bacterium]|nr:ABC transporter permease [Burkholderiaceae bacterium]